MSERCLSASAIVDVKALYICERSGLPCGSASGRCSSSCLGSCNIGDCRENKCLRKYCTAEKDLQCQKAMLGEGGIKMENKNRKENCPEDEDRRKFISGAGLVAGSIVLLGAGGLAVSGCSVSGEYGSAEKCTTTTTRTTTINDVEYLGECICPDCGIIVSHPKGTPCRLVPCPKCGVGMGRYT
jgi:hypothetical protein